MPIQYQAAPPERAAGFLQLRGITRQNPIGVERLAAMGITAASWAQDIESGHTQGFMATSGDALLGYCFGDTRTGEVLVLAVHPEHEGQGIGRALLDQVVEQLRRLGHTHLFLGCSRDASMRSHGFYRHLGWRSAGAVDARGDEILELVVR